MSSSATIEAKFCDRTWTLAGPGGLSHELLD
jgi:hypothetical protein